MKLENSYLPIIGLEVHVELTTKSKMFCSCSAQHFQVEPNTHTCPVCLGLPGALPVPNKRAIDWCLIIGLALRSRVASESKFDRKNYFYPDLPKGYQISQYDMPFCRKGFLNIKTEKGIKKVRIHRVHMEEDTGKLIHTTIEGKKATLIDFNRSGVPLVEVVSEPDINSTEEATAYLKKLQQVIRYLGVSDCDMEKGSMRLEANVSLQKKGSNKLPPYKVEIKNINSFRFVGRAINYEIERQKRLLDSGEKPIQETRGFDVKTGKTYSQRSKEEAHDYRYFPEPDIPPFTNLKVRSKKLKASLPQLPDEKINHFIKDYKVSPYNAEIIAADKKTADYFEEATRVLLKLKVGDKFKVTDIANIIVNKKIDIEKYLPAELIQLLLKKTTTATIDESKLREVVKIVLEKNQKATSDYKKGKETAITFLIGQVMRETKGKADPKLVRKLIKQALS